MDTIDALLNELANAIYEHTDRAGGTLEVTEDDSNKNQMVLITPEGKRFMLTIEPIGE